MTERSPSAPSSDAIDALAGFCLETGYDALPPEVIEATKNQVLDTVGIALAGRHAAGVAQLRDWTLDIGGKPQSLVWGTHERVPAVNAVRVNASMAHALEFDDTYERSFIHASVVAIPTALAAAEMVGGVSGKTLIAALATGIDAACRISRAGSPGADAFVLGWDPTPMYGGLAAALIAGTVLGLSREQLVSAAGLAFHQMAGNSQGNLDGAHSKRLGPGFAASNGILSASLAKRGVVGAFRVLEGSKGLYAQYHGGSYSRELLLDGLGVDFAGAEIAPKPYPSCRGGHNAIDAALALRSELGISPDDIERITIHTGPGEFGLLGAPIDKKRRPPSVVDAQFSNPWMVAAALQDGAVTLHHFTPQALQREDLLALTQRTLTVEDKSLGRPGGGPGAVRVEIELRGGAVHSRHVTHAKGDPRNPMSAQELGRKFHDCTALAGMSEDAAAALLQRLQHLELESDVSMLVAAMAAPP